MCRSKHDLPVSACHSQIFLFSSSMMLSGHLEQLYFVFLWHVLLYPCFGLLFHVPYLLLSFSFAGMRCAWMPALGLPVIISNSLDFRSFSEHQLRIATCQSHQLGQSYCRWAPQKDGCKNHYGCTYCMLIGSMQSKYPQHIHPRFSCSPFLSIP